MSVHGHFTNREFRAARAQAMIEFAIVAPILFLLLFGIFEVGRMIYVYSAVTNASREAVRFGSAVGYDDSGELKYKHCDGIREMARRSAFFMGLEDSDIVIEYDEGPGTSVFNDCPDGVDVAPGYFVKSGDRILVTVTAHYTPYTSLIPWGPRDFISSSARTILGYVSLTSTPNATATSGPWTATATATSTDGPSPTPTDTPTATATFSGSVASLTPLPTDTITPTETSTSTPTNTPTPTYTPTTVPECGGITASPISYSGKQMSMTITNPYEFPVMVQDIEVTWNAISGGPENSILALNSGSLGSFFWAVNNSSGTFTITPSTEVTIPGGGAVSTITFTFDQDYDNTNGSESIVINLSTPGCESSQIRWP